MMMNIFLWAMSPKVNKVFAAVVLALVALVLLAVVVPPVGRAIDIVLVWAMGK